MNHDYDQYAANEYQELIVDSKGNLTGSKGKLFQFKGIGGELDKNSPISKVLDSLWSAKVEQLCSEAFNKGTTGTYTFERTGGGDNLALLFVAVPSVYSGRVKGLVLTIHDITIAKRLERQQSLAEKMKTISQLASQIVHKMNNPIAAILNRIGGLLVEDLDQIESQKLEQELREIQEQLYSVSLVTNALTIFSTESKKEFKLVQINTIIEHSVNLIKLVNFNKKVDVDLRLQKDLPRILGSEVTLEQCLVNVLKNAAESIDENPKITITSRIDKEFSDFINLSIADNGVGIPPEQLELVFDPFFTTKDKSHNGLGLSVCYGIISNHGGSIEIYSKEGKGTIVQIILPIAKL